MEWIEVVARTVDEAKELALDRLGVVEDELEYEVVDEPRPGLFGRLGRTDARIRARVKPVSREKPGDRRHRRGSERPARSERARPEGPSGSGGVAEAGRTGGDRHPPAPTRRRRRRARAGGAPGNARDAGSGTTRPRVASPDRIVEEENVNVETVPLAEQADTATRFTEELLDAFGLSARVAADIGDDEVLVRVDGAGLGVLVGPRGATLHALEELVRAVVQHASGGHSARLHVDVGGYRQRRREALAEFARRVAAEVHETGNERALEPMSSADRKVVHDVVAEVEGVTTASEGEDPRRHVVIKPA